MYRVLESRLAYLGINKKTMAEETGMCESVNNTEVREDEVLNDRCFLYTVANNTITLI